MSLPNTLDFQSSRPDGRACDAMREISMTVGTNPYAEGSCLVKFGQTEVLCTASLMDGVPRWLKGSKSGWLTAEYGMLPRSTADRKDREAVKGKQEGRTVEIQRLIGRSLRSVTDLKALDGLTMWLDCDVLVADGGTRTAAITGAWVAAALAAKGAFASGRVKRDPFPTPLAAISCGVTQAGVVLDMDYAEDSATFADGNFALNGTGEWVELQISAEKRPVSAIEMAEMQRLALLGAQQLIDLQKRLISQV